MPRPNKTGLDYFPLDCHMDTAMELIEAEHGAVGFMVIVKLWQMIYGENGYFCNWDDIHQKSFARKNGLSVDDVSSVVISAITHHLFDNNLAQRGVLTSTGIQKRFANMTSKRKSIDVYTDLLLIPIDKLGSKQQSYSTVVNQQLYFQKEVKRKVSSKVISEITPDQIGINGESKQKVNMERKEETPPTEKRLPDESIAIAQKLFTFHRDRIDSGYKVSDSNLRKWAEDIDKLNRLDGRSWSDIERAIDWIKKPGQFWAANIMSGAKLRAQFSAIWPKIPANYTNTQKSIDNSLFSDDAKPKRQPKKCGNPECGAMEDIVMTECGQPWCHVCFGWDFENDKKWGE